MKATDGQSRERIIVCGALANKPFNGGNAWSRLGWVLGFKRLGFEVLFIEQINRRQCVDSTGVPSSFDDSVQLGYFREVVSGFGLNGFATLICDDGAETWGARLDDLIAQSRQTELLFNFGGHLSHPELLVGPAHRLYYDDDPGYTQFWHARGDAGSRLEGHDSYFTIGLNIGRSGCEIPCGDIRWQHTRPPVVLERWPAVPQTTLDRFTTVASWRGAYGPVEWGNRKYGLKVHEFRKFMDLPRQSDAPFEVALDIHPGDVADRQSLIGHGWRVVDPSEVAASPRSYQRYLQSSGAEFSVAQGIYVDTGSGWISDRTVRYLASGKPALVQDTGLARHLPLNEGLLTFKTMETAVDGVKRIVNDYGDHCRAARRLAEDYFDSDQVIGELLSKIGVSVPAMGQEQKG